MADNHLAFELADGVHRLVQEDYADANCIALIMDNLNTQTGASLYKVFAPDVARVLMDKQEFIYTPRRGRRQG